MIAEPAKPQQQIDQQCSGGGSLAGSLPLECCTEVSMRKYAKVTPRFWLGSTARELRDSPEATIVAMYLITSPHANMLGCYYIPESLIAHETGLPFEGASKGLRRCCEAGFCFYDSDVDLVFVPNMARIQTGETISTNDNRRKAAQACYNDLCVSPLVSMFFDTYGEAYNLEKRADYKDLGSPFEGPSEAPSKPVSSKQEAVSSKEKTCALGEQVHLPVVSEKSKPAPGGKTTDEFSEVYGHYRQYHPRLKGTPKSGSKEYRQVKNRLAEGFTVQDLCRAIDALHRSPWHNGQNEQGKKYLRLGLAIESADKVEEWLEAVPQEQNAPKPEMSEQFKNIHRLCIEHGLIPPARSEEAECLELFKPWLDHRALVVEAACKNHTDLMTYVRNERQEQPSA